MEKKLKKLDRKTSPFRIKPKLINSHWVTPSLVAQIKFEEWAEDDAMRHPVFLSLKTDKDAKQVILESKKGTKEIFKGALVVKNEKVSFTNLSSIYDRLVEKGDL